MKDLTYSEKMARAREIAAVLPARVVLKNQIVHRVADAYVHGAIETKEAALVKMIEALAAAHDEIVTAAVNAATERPALFVKL